MDKIMQDIGYQASILNMLEDKGIFSKHIFQNPVIMATYMVDKIKEMDGVEEVAYDGATSSIHLKTFNDASAIVEFAIIGILDEINPNVNAIKTIGSSLVDDKLMMHTEIGIISAMNWIQQYVSNPSLLNSFFKVFDMRNGSYIISFI